MAANPYNFEFKRAKAELDACAWPSTAYEIAAPQFWDTVRDLLEIAHDKVQADNHLPQAVFSRYPRQAVIELAIMGMKTELYTYKEIILSAWALHNLAHALLGLANVSKGKNYHLLDCPAVAATLLQEERSFLWGIVAEYIYQQAFWAVRHNHLDDDLIQEIAHNAWISAKTGIATYREDAKLSTWLSKITGRKVLDHLRYPLRHPILKSIDECEDDANAWILPPTMDHPEIDASSEHTMMILNALLDEVERRFKHVPIHNWIKAKRILRAFRGSEKDGIAHDISAMLGDGGMGISHAAVAELMEYIAECIEERLEQAKGNGDAGKNAM
jgi:DNA-directed RNA polymerase specialized sigma24 family protein